MKIPYHEIIKAQLQGFSKFTPVADGDWAIVLDEPEKGFREHDVVRIEKIVGEFCFVKKYKRSRQGWVHTNNLEKIKMVYATSDGDENQTVPVRVEQITTLKEENPKLWLYFGKRIKQIFSDKMVDTDEIGQVVPKINPKIVIGEFLDITGAEGFVSKWGPDTGTIYVNIKANFPVDEVVSHEFSHILSFYSKELSEKLNDPSIQMGVNDEEMDESNIGKPSEEMQDKMKNLDEQGRAKLRSEEYFLKPSEVFAHTEQMRYLVHKFKNLDMQHVKMDDSMTAEQKQQAIHQIEARPIKDYKRQVMARLLPFLQEKYKIKDYTARKIYESLFDNIEEYA